MTKANTKTSIKKDPQKKHPSLRKGIGACSWIFIYLFQTFDFQTVKYYYKNIYRCFSAIVFYLPLLCTTFEKNEFENFSILIFDASFIIGL